MNCIVCDIEVHPERVAFLLDNNKEITCINHALPVSIKAVYSGEHGTSELIFCDRLYDDSLAAKFESAEEITLDDTPIDDTEDL